jgi:hypothetical protein
LLGTSFMVSLLQASCTALGVFGGMAMFDMMKMCVGTQCDPEIDFMFDLFWKLCQQNLVWTILVCIAVRR